ncbi:16493_t:CDS:2 [Funneliformis geosporum]|nr:16493_t:CDS:2 [Funneliformis geosporum]
MDWLTKLKILRRIAFGLGEIHFNKYIHRDIHCGNILIHGKKGISITDLGLCRPANQPNDRKLYGVLPFLAPEILRGKKYTQNSDIYAFGIVAFEVMTGFPPHKDVADDHFLHIEICKGLRPESTYKVPRQILEIIEQCWDEDPLKQERLKIVLS